MFRAEYLLRNGATGISMRMVYNRLAVMTLSLTSKTLDISVSVAIITSKEVL